MFIYDRKETSTLLKQISSWSMTYTRHYKTPKKPMFSVILSGNPDVITINGVHYNIVKLNNDIEFDNFPDELKKLKNIECEVALFTPQEFKLVQNYVDLNRSRSYLKSMIKPTWYSEYYNEQLYNHLSLVLDNYDYDEDFNLSGLSQPIVSAIHGAHKLNYNVLVAGTRSIINFKIFSEYTRFKLLHGNVVGDSQLIFNQGFLDNMREIL